jgi:hypothetical protein
VAGVAERSRGAVICLGLAAVILGSLLAWGILGLLTNPGTSAAWLAYKAERGSFQVEHPSYMAPQEFSFMRTRVVTFRTSTVVQLLRTAGFPSPPTTIALTVSVLPARVGATDVLENLRTQEEGKPSFHEVSRGEMTVDGHLAEVMSYDVFQQTADGSRALERVEEAVANIGGRTYSMTETAPVQAWDQAMFDRFLASFRSIDTHAAS